MFDRVQIVRNFYKAFANGDRDFVETCLTHDFTFSAPPDPYLDRKGYFERCWPGSNQGQHFEFLRLFEHENEIVVTYEMTSRDGKKGRNTEIITFFNDKVQRVEVYFGP